MLANLLAGMFLILLMWDTIPHKILLIWITTLVSASAFTLLFYSYLKPAFKNINTIPDKLFYYQLPFLFGCIWGAAGYFFAIPYSMTDTAFLIIFLFGMVSGGLSSLSSLWLSYFLFAVPVLLPFSFRFIFAGHTHTVLLGSVIISYLVIMLLISKLTHELIAKTLKAKYINSGLIKDLKQQTEQANKLCIDKSRFLASASHDLRQPIHSLSLLSSAIEPEIETDRGKTILRQIEKANGVMLDLLNSLLDISKLDADIIKPNIVFTDINETIEELIDEFKQIAQQNGIELRVRTCPFMIKTDPVLLSTILRNLIQNALSFTEKGKILISCRRKNNKILLQVWDTGKGIPSQYQEDIFAEFQQLHNPERDRNKGLGLGLAICKRISTLLNITIKVKSVVGKGSVFTLEIPTLTEGEAKEYLNNKPAPVYSTVIPDINNIVILIIDDNEIVLEAMTMLLQNWGCKILTADSVSATQKLAQTHKGKIDIIIADYRLREGTTGVEAIDTFTKYIDYSVPSVLITGDTSPERMREISSHGLPVLHKPVKEPQLKVVIGRLLRLSA